MDDFLTSRRALLKALAASALVAGCAVTSPPRIDASELLSLGFKPLVATTTVQQEWVQTLPAGQVRSMQRNGKRFFIYPDASRNQIYVGGPNEFARYQQRYPDRQASTQEVADKAQAYRVRQDEKMGEATARDLSDPFLGATWYDLGW